MTNLVKLINLEVRFRISYVYQMLKYTNLNRLYYFHSIASHGSIKAAARALHITQPALSVALKQLEAELKKKLFLREHRKLVLTRSGRTLFDYTSKIYSLAGKAIAEVKGLGQAAESLRIGIVPSISRAVVNSFLDKLWSENRVLSIHQKAAGELTDLLHDKRLELILTDSRPQKLDRDWTVLQYAQRRMMFVGSRHHRDLKRDFPRSLNGARYIGHTESNPLRFEVDRYFAAQSVRPKLIAEIDDFNLLLVVLKQGRGVGLISEQAAAEAIKNKHLFVIGVPSSIESPVWLIIRKDAAALFKNSRLTGLTTV